MQVYKYSLRIFKSSKWFANYAFIWKVQFGKLFCYANRHCHGISSSLRTGNPKPCILWNLYTNKSKTGCNHLTLMIENLIVYRYILYLNISHRNIIDKKSREKLMAISTFSNNTNEMTKQFSIGPMLFHIFYVFDLATKWWNMIVFLVKLFCIYVCIWSVWMRKSINRNACDKFEVHLKCIKFCYKIHKIYTWFTRKEICASDIISDRNSHLISFEIFCGIPISFSQFCGCCFWCCCYSYVSTQQAAPNGILTSFTSSPP